MKKTSIATFTIITTALLLALAMASSVEACNTWNPLHQKHFFSASMTPGVYKVTIGEVSVTSNGNTHVTGSKVEFFNSQLTLGSSSYVLYGPDVRNANYNPKTQTLVAHAEATWYVGSGTTVSANGFAGNIEQIEYGVPSFPPALSRNWISAHCVLQGFGSFEGMTLLLSYNGPPGGVWTGFAITR